MHGKHPLHASVVDLLRKYGKVSDTAVSGFLQGFSLVQYGLRLAYLVDTLAIPEDCLTRLQILLNQDSPDDSAIVLFYERSTMQGFLISASLLLKTVFPDEYAIFIDTSTREAVQPDQATTSTLSAVLEELKAFSSKHKQDNEACSLDITADEPVNNSDDYETKLAWAQSTMITLSGMLLEYPYIYYSSPKTLSTKPEGSLNNVPLCVTEFLLRSSEYEDVISVIKFSTPQAQKDAAPAAFANLVERCRAKYQARMTVSRHPQLQGHSIEWRVSDNVLLQNVAL